MNLGDSDEGNPNGSIPFDSGFWSVREQHPSDLLGVIIGQSACELHPLTESGGCRNCFAQRSAYFSTNVDSWRKPHVFYGDVQPKVKLSPWYRIGGINIERRRLSEFNLSATHPRPLRQSKLASDKIDAFLGSLRLLLTNGKLFPRIQFTYSGPGSSGFGLASHNLRLVGHDPHLYTDEDSSGGSSQKAEYRNPVGFPRDGESLLLERFEIIPTDHPHKYWLGWVWIAASAACVVGSWWLLWRGCNWLNDTGIGELSFLLALVGFVGLCHGIALL